MFNSVDGRVGQVDSGASFPRNELQRLKLAAATAEHFDSADVAWPKMLPKSAKHPATFRCLKILQ